MTVRSPIVIAGIVLALTAAAVTLNSIAHAPSARYIEAASIGKQAKNFDELAERFQVLARDRGALYAFEVLRRAELPQDTDIHLLGHAIGDELYTQKGVAGMADCTQEFRNACSHSVVIGALTEWGEDALSLIHDACRRAPGGRGAYTMCFHGLGHGVFSYYDYSLPETVAFCEETSTKEYAYREAVECIGGAVMELTGGGGHDRDKWLAARARYFPDDKPLWPCIGALIPDIAREICLTYLTPRLWEHANIDPGRPDPQRFAEAFALCDAISQEQGLRDACFGGFGKEFVVLAAGRDVRGIDQLSDEEYSTAIRWCELASVPDGIHSCIADALASVFWGGENDPDASFRFCALARDEGQEACWERLAESIATWIGDASDRQALCARIPRSSRSACELYNVLI
ncbi:hypothetical protein HY418_03685 [Candidatus Kaiserbacteria bacterium]|nr:hypothetical protein [Candidatus Kaiserbacteria bacterium]